MFAYVTYNQLTHITVLGRTISTKTQEFVNELKKMCTEIFKKISLIEEQNS